MSKEFDFLVFIGRFQPFHIGHKNVIDAALEKADNVIILIGSNNVARSYFNPFTFAERKEMIKLSYPEDVRERLLIVPSDDVYNNQIWIKGTQETVQSVILKHINRETPHIILHGWKGQKVGLIGHNKDHSSYYLKLFPEWGHIDVLHTAIYNATDIRKEYFTSTPRIPPHILTKASAKFLTDFLRTEDFVKIYKEFKYVEEYKKAWAHAPYEPIFVTTDAVIIQSGHVLVVRRRAFPGQGLLALPGGFLGPTEYIEDSMIRELREETKIKVPVPVLKGNIKAVKVFDSPYRSSRGRTVTHAFLIELPAKIELPKIKAGSDAAAAFWMPLANLKADEMFEDHYFIIQDMIGGL